MIIVTGQSDALLGMVDGADWQKLILKSQMIVSDLTVEMWLTGEEIIPAVQFEAEALAELGFA